eukprot:UN05380
MYGGHWEPVKKALSGNIKDIFSCELGFAALDYDGNVVIWGGGWLTHDPPLDEVGPIKNYREEY